LIDAAAHCWVSELQKSFSNLTCRFSHDMLVLRDTAREPPVSLKNIRNTAAKLKNLQRKLSHWKLAAGWLETS